MTLANLRTLTRGYVPGYKTSGNTLLDLILNQGVVDIAGYTACLKENALFDVEADEDEYNLSTEVTDFLTMDKPGLWWHDGTQWTKLHPRTLKWLDDKRPGWRDYTSANPQNYSIDGDVLTISPPPDTDLTDGFKIYYGEMPGNMAVASSYTFSGSTTRYTHLEVFNDAIIAFARWKMQQALNKDQGDAFRLLENAYKRARDEAFGLFKRRKDISADKDAKLQGPIINE